MRRDFLRMHCRTDNDVSLPLPGLSERERRSVFKLISVFCLLQHHADPPRFEYRRGRPNLIAS